MPKQCRAGTGASPRIPVPQSPPQGCLSAQAVPTCWSTYKMAPLLNRIWCGTPIPMVVYSLGFFQMRSEFAFGPNTIFFLYRSLYFVFNATPRCPCKLKYQVKGAWYLVSVCVEGGGGWNQCGQDSLSPPRSVPTTSGTSVTQPFWLVFDPEGAQEERVPGFPALSLEISEFP